MSNLPTLATGPVQLPGTITRDTIVFIDAEVSPETGKIVDLGACRPDGRFFHSSNVAAFKEFCKGAEYVCGHNIVAFDMQYLRPVLGDGPQPVDTLPLSALLFPRKRFHKLLKDEKLLTEELNNPLSDARKAMALFEEEVAAFGELPGVLQRLFCSMLKNQAEFAGFFRCLNIQTPAFADPAGVIKRLMADKLCTNADLDRLSRRKPAEMAYALAFIRAAEPHDVIPPWVNTNYPAVQSVIRQLAEWSAARGAQIGYDNVFDYSLGNPSVPCPPQFNDALARLVAQADPVALHGYSPTLTIPSVRAAVAENLRRRFGVPYTADHIFMTTGAAGALAHALRCVAVPGQAVVTFAPFFPEYKPYVEGAGLTLRVLPPRVSDFQIDFDALEAALDGNVAAGLINPPNTPSGIAYSPETLRRLADTLAAASARLGHHIFLVSDEPYREIVFGGAPQQHPAAYYADTLTC